MNAITVAVVNDKAIQVSNDEEQLVPIKPICDALGIDPKAQRQKISEDEFLAPVGVLSTSTGSDGKQYEMYCLPLKYVYGWLFTINPKNVAEDAREAVMRYRAECYNALYDHFSRRFKRVIEANQQEIDALYEINEYTQSIQDCKDKLRNARKRLDEIRQRRLTEQPSLFD